jgi:L-threonylcarbamoyladenylate synthase
VEELGSDTAGLARAAALLRAGQVIAIPTDTVYGLAALARDAAARARIHEIKGRSLDQPLILMAGEVAQFERWVEVSERARELMDRFWPGPLTLILPARQPAERASIGVRIPAHPAALALLTRIGEGLATTSANRSGEAPALTAAGAAALDGVAAVLDGGAAPGGRASTVLDLSGEIPRLVREGPISAADLGLAEPAG